MLPGLSGEKVLPKIKAVQDIPILVLSAKDSLDSKLELLKGGADDYMTKPFSLEELTARMNILLKNSKSSGNKSILRHHDLVVDEQNFRAEIQGHVLNLTNVELRILTLLLKNPGRVFSKQDIYEYAWDDFYIGSDKTINVHISNIRKKLKAFSEREYIETVWGIGFRLAP